MTPRPRPRIALTRSGLVVPALLASSCLHATAQTPEVVTLDLGFASEHDWRGLGTSRPQASLGVSAWNRLGGGYVGGGAWMLGMPFVRGEPSVNRPRDDQGSLGFAPLENELDLWFEYGHTFTKAQVAVGVAHYFLNDLEVDPDAGHGLPNTTEVYARVELTNRVLTPGANVYLDVHNVVGTYAELFATARIPVGPNTGAYLKGLVGFNVVGQEYENGTGYFTGKGRTLVDVSGTLPIWLTVDGVSAAVFGGFRAPSKYHPSAPDPAGDGDGFYYGVMLSVDLER